MKLNELYGKYEDRFTHSSTIDMGTLPLCRKSLEQHNRRVNFQVGIWERAHVANPDIPEPCNGHGWTLVEGKLEPLWFEGGVLQQQVGRLHCRFNEHH